MTTNPYAEAIEAARLALQGRTGRTRQSTQRDAETAVDAATPRLLAPIRALHRVREVKAITDIDCVREDCDHEDECPTQPVETCAHCWDIAERANMYFAESGIPEEVLWPCPTTAALDAIESEATSEGGCDAIR